MYTSSGINKYSNINANANMNVNGVQTGTTNGSNYANTNNSNANNNNLQSSTGAGTYCELSRISTDFQYRGPSLQEIRSPEDPHIDLVAHLQP